MSFLETKYRIEKGILPKELDDLPHTCEECERVKSNEESTQG